MGLRLGNIVLPRAEADAGLVSNLRVSGVILPGPQALSDALTALAVVAIGTVATCVDSNKHRANCDELRELHRGNVVGGVGI